MAEGYVDVGFVIGDAVHGATGANVETVVTLDGDYGVVEIINRDGADDLFYVVDGAAEIAVGGRGTGVIPRGGGWVVTRSRSGGTTTVRLRSTVAVQYSVLGLTY